MVHGRQRRSAGQITGQGNPARILIGGSLYLAGEILSENS